MRIVQLGEERPIDKASFTATARTEWSGAKDAYLDAARHMNSLLTLLHEPGSDGRVRVTGRVTGALYTAKQLRDAADAMITALDEIVRAGKRVEGDT
jgi:hypothetical protein